MDLLLVFSGDKAPCLGTRFGLCPAALLRYQVTWLNFGSASASAAQHAQAAAQTPRPPYHPCSVPFLDPRCHWILTPCLVGLSLQGSGNFTRPSTKAQILEPKGRNWDPLQRR